MKRKLIPISHGLYRENNMLPMFRVGILTVFDVLLHTKLIHLRGKIRYSSPLKDLLLKLFMTTTRLVPRLLYSLDRLQMELNHCEDSFNQKGINPRVFVNETEITIAVDSIFNYLSIFLDHIATMSLYVLFNDKKVNKKIKIINKRRKIEPISFNKLLRSSQSDFELSLIRPIFEKLEKNKSWWELGFERGKGIRQRLIHYPDYVSLQGAGVKNERVKVQCFLIGNPRKHINIVDHLRTILHAICLWLDAYEKELRSILSKRAAKAKIEWVKKSSWQFPIYNMPIAEEKVVPACDFLYLPICQGSTPIECKFKMNFAT